MVGGNIGWIAWRRYRGKRFGGLDWFLAVSTVLTLALKLYFGIAVAQTPPPIVLDLATGKFIVESDYTATDSKPDAFEIGCGPASGAYTIIGTVVYAGAAGHQETPLSASQLISADGKYFCAARAVNALGKTAYTAEIFVNALRKAPPPTRIKTGGNARNFFVSWTRPAGAKLSIVRWGAEPNVWTSAKVVKVARVKPCNFLPQGRSWLCIAARYAAEESDCAGAIVIRRAGSRCAKIA
jgi:hypothetical protein